VVGEIEQGTEQQLVIARPSSISPTTR